MNCSSESETGQAFPELRHCALHLLVESCPLQKAKAVGELALAWQKGELVLNPSAAPVALKPIPGRPERPLLVGPMEVKRRSMATVEGRAILLHALAHIEFNAINLALDAVWRFPAMPQDYYADWLRVASEEATHFSLLLAHLEEQGYAYGDFPAHNSLWEMVEKTTGDVLARMALVPRTMEARGLDATPAVRARLAQAGDHRAAHILDIILRDEIGHVAVGNRWFGWLCRQRALEPVATYRELARQYNAPRLRGPFNVEARRQAGFTEPELEQLIAQDIS